MGLQSTYRSNQLKPRAHGSLSIVLMRLGIPEVNQWAPSPMYLAAEPAEALHGVSDALLIGRNDLAEVFRVHACPQCR